MKKILIVLFLSIKVFALAPVTSVVPENKILKSVKQTNPETYYAIIATTQYDKCANIDWSKMDDKYLSYLSSKYKALLASLESAYKLSDINLLANKMISDKCKINAFQKETKKTKEKKKTFSKKKVKKDKIIKQKNNIDILKKVRLLTGISNKAKEGSYPAIFIDDKQCTYFVKVDIKNNLRLGKIEKKICNGQAKVQHGLVFNKDKLIDNIDYSLPGSIFYFYEF